MKVFLIVSYDNDEQQVFWDYAPGKDEDEAKGKVGDIRGNYANVIDAITVRDLRSMYLGLRKATPTTAIADLIELKGQHGDQEYDDDMLTGGGE